MKIAEENEFLKQEIKDLTIEKEKLETIQASINEIDCSKKLGFEDVRKS